jgi:hypothetical protein
LHCLRRAYAEAGVSARGAFGYGEEVEVTKVKLVSVKCFEAFTEGGESLGLFKQETEWHGMRCLRSFEGGQQLIIDGDPDIFGAIFADIFGGQRTEANVVKATPDLALKIRGNGHSQGCKCPKCYGGAE